MASESVKDQWRTIWAGGRAIADYVTRCPEVVKDKHVADFGAGSGVATFAALMAGARLVEAYDINPDAVANLKSKIVPGLVVHGESAYFKPVTADVILLGSMPISPKLLIWLIEIRYAGKNIIISSEPEFILPKHMTKIEQDIWSIKFPAHPLLEPKTST